MAQQQKQQLEKELSAEEGNIIMPCIFVPISHSSSSPDSFAFEWICFLCFKRKFDRSFLVLRLVLGCKIENRYVYSSVGWYQGFF